MPAETFIWLHSWWDLLGQAKAQIQTQGMSTGLLVCTKVVLRLRKRWVSIFQWSNFVEIGYQAKTVLTNIHKYYIYKMCYTYNATSFHRNWPRHLIVIPLVQKRVDMSTTAHSYKQMHLNKLVSNNRSKQRYYFILYIDVIKYASYSQCPISMQFWLHISNRYYWVINRCIIDAKAIMERKEGLEEGG